MKLTRILMDMTMTAQWRRAGSMVGIVRASTELYESLKKTCDVRMVTMAPGAEGAEPRILTIDPGTLLPTEEEIRPEAGDLFLMAEIQIRGVHVPVDYPWPGYLAGYGVDRCAVIYDILPIEMPDCFEPPTVRGMPEYTLGILKNFNRIICDSEAVVNSVARFAREGLVPPLDLEVDFGNDGILHHYLTKGWRKEGAAVVGTDGARFAFFTNVTDADLVLDCVCESAPGTGDVRVVLNGYDVGLIAERPHHEEHFVLPAGALKPDGAQEIRFAADGGAAASLTLRSLAVFSVRQEAVPVRGEMDGPVSLGFAHLGVTERKAKGGGTPDPALDDFLSKDKNAPVFLMVGTIEPRKGYDLAFRAFESLWAAGGQEKLCIIGSAGWNMQGFIARLRGHGENGKRLLVLEGASDATLNEAYRRADALLQASAGEGFGLPLIEAGSRGIPVLCSDIPVFHEVGGEHVLYFERTEEALVRCIHFFEEHRGTPEIPDPKGICGRSWDDCAADCKALVEGEKPWPVTLEADEKPAPAPRKKAVVAMTFPVWPPRGGGQARVYGLYRNLAREYDIEIVCLEGSGGKRARRIIAPGLTETVVLRTVDQERKENEFAEKAGVAAADIGLLLYGDLTPEYGAALERAGAEADLLIACHPYSYPLMRRLFPDKTLVYEAQDVEYALRKSLYRPGPETAEALEQLRRAEEACCRESLLIMTCSEEDRQKLAALYGIDPEKILVVPNGVDTEQIRYTSVEERLKRKQRAGLGQVKAGVFMGSCHGPNLEAARAVIRAAADCPGVKFYLMGDQCNVFAGEELPENVGLMGVVSDEEKRRVFSLIDFGLNPITSGSGTNLKMFDYMAAGVPVITTAFGSRGIDRKDVFVTAENEELAGAVNAFDLGGSAERTAEARRYMEETFDWKVIAKRVAERIRELRGEPGLDGREEPMV